MGRRTLLAALLALAVAAPAQAATDETESAWATVNICDTEEHPNQMGVRVSMPGTGKGRETMHARVRAQFLTSSGKWKRVGGTAVSRWIDLGSARYERREGGWIFPFDPPGNGRAFTLRAVADFEWRTKKRVRGKVRTVVVRTERATTEVRDDRVEGADPADFSAGACQIY